MREGGKGDSQAARNALGLVGCRDSIWVFLPPMIDQCAAIMLCSLLAVEGLSRLEEGVFLETLYVPLR
jgi:hypothetical protein